jgi:hypothetical protein
MPHLPSLPDSMAVNCYSQPVTGRTLPSTRTKKMIRRDLRTETCVRRMPVLHSTILPGTAHLFSFFNEGQLRPCFEDLRRPKARKKIAWRGALATEKGNASSMTFRNVAPRAHGQHIESAKRFGIARVREGLNCAADQIKSRVRDSARSQNPCKSLPLTH